MGQTSGCHPCRTERRAESLFAGLKKVVYPHVSVNPDEMDADQEKNQYCHFWVHLNDV